MSLNLPRQLNSTSNIVKVRAFTISTGAPKTDVAHDTSGLVVKVGLNGAALTSIGTLVTMTVGTWTTLGFKHDSGGVYQIGVPNTHFDDAVGELLVAPEGVTDCYFVPEIVPITASDVYAAKVAATIAAGDLAANSVTASALATDAVTEIVDAIVAEAESTPLEVNVKKINDVTVIGAGTSGNKWRA